MKTKKIVSVLLCILIVLMMPVTALAAGGENVSMLIVGGTQITAKGYYTNNAEGIWEKWTALDKPSSGYIYYDGNFTLTLNGVDITGAPATPNGAGIYVDGTRLTIAIKGVCSVSGVTDSTGCSSAVYSTGNLVFSVTSTGTLNADGAQVTGDSGISYGIFAIGDITVSAGNLNVNGGLVTSQEGASFGVYSSDGSVTVKNGTLNARGGETANALGGSFGVYSYDDVTVSGGTLTAEGGSVSSNMSASFGVYSYNNVLVDGGTLSTVGGASGFESYGTAANNNVTVNDGKLFATGGTVTGGMGASYGIRAGSKVTVYGGTVTASGGTAETDSYGICAVSTAVGSDQTAGAVLVVNGQYDGILGDLRSNSNSLVLQNGSGRVSGSVSLNHDLLLPEDGTLTIPANASLTVPAGVTLIKDGTLINKGDLTINGDIRHTGWQIIDDVKYYYRDDGLMATDSWVETNGKWYYLTEDGSMAASEWVEWMGKWYYFYSTGIMAVNITIDGYAINSNGVSIR